MFPINRIFFLGLGAIGAKYASMFYDNSPESVYVIVDEQRKQRYLEEGFIINHKSYSFQYITKPDDSLSADLIVLGVKSTELQVALETLQPFVNENTVILSLLNGIGTKDYIENFFGRDVAVYSIVYMDAVKTNNRISFAHPGKVVFGEKINVASYSERVQNIANLFDRFGIAYEIPKDMLLSLWRKFLINVVGNQLTFVLEVGYESLQDNPFVNNLIYEVGGEIVRVANALGIDLAISDIDKMIETMRLLPGKAYTSMVQDRINGRVSEVEIFAGEIMKLGEKLSIDTPYNTMLYNLIKAYEWERDNRS